MPPQQFQRLLDFIHDLLDFGAHSMISSTSPAGQYPAAGYDANA
jgi:hypothetical protein